ncbi:hypothetical protein [Rhizobium leguminosarum]|uniref:hypothetical protein n=1 Tax=Rhizobium leguminosarum TaxID=384 RepID=UPI003F9808C3
MTTADWALIISLLSFCVSLAGFVWNVWSKFIFPKARVQVHFSVNILIQEGEPDHEMLVLHATNFGPGEITLHTAIGRAQPSKFKKLTHLMLNPLHNFPLELNRTVGPFSGGLPRKIQPGESHSAYFVLLHEAFRDQPIVDVGFSDTFGRSHWATRKQVAAVRRAVKEAYRNA